MDRERIFQIIIVLTVIGMGIDGLLLYQHYADADIGCPLGGGGCDIVAGSIYSEVMGIPISVFGMGALLVFLALSVLALEGRLDEKLALKAIFVLSALGMVYAAFLIYAMFFILFAICSWCMFSHIVLALILIFSGYGFLKK